MTNEELFNAITNIRDEQIAEAEKHTFQRKKPVWRRYAAAAAALLLVAGGTFAVLRGRGQAAASAGPHAVRRWSETMSAADYFRDNSDGGSVSSSSSTLSSDAIPWSDMRSFSGAREALEDEGTLPAMPDHPLFDCTAYYNADESVYKLVFRWYSYAPYSSFTLTVAPEEIHEISDVVSIALDEDGNVIDPAVTVTERDGVLIAAEGFEWSGRTLTWQMEAGWYQLSCHNTDSYETLAALLDWFWEHPIDFDRFPIEAGDEYTAVYLAGYEGAEELLRHAPDFAALGYVPEDTPGLTLKNGKFYSMELHYLSGVTEEEALAASYPDGVAKSVSWGLATEPNVYEQAETLGELADLRFEQVAAARAESQHIRFTWDGYSVFVYVGSNVTAEELWELVASVQ